MYVYLHTTKKDAFYMRSKHYRQYVELAVYNDSLYSLLGSALALCFFCECPLLPPVSDERGEGRGLLWVAVLAVLADEGAVFFETGWKRGKGGAEGRWDANAKRRRRQKQNKRHAGNIKKNT